MNRKHCILLGLIVFLFSCSSKQQSFMPAENGLDAGREFIDGCLKGDFIKAHFYLLPDESNEQLLKTTEASYREKDKEGRQELRTSSINIQSVQEPNDSTVTLHYSLSSDTTSKALYIIKREANWLVDYKKSFKQ
ncbi:MAG: hypothetical protein WCP74_10330 [Sphingobacteriia bacterium]